MPHQPAVSDETEFDGLPRQLPDQDAILVGRVGDRAAYYVHGRGDVLIGRYENRAFVPSYTVECERRLPSACVRAFSAADEPTDLSSVGTALLQAWHLGDRTPLSHKQAHVYALREIGEFGRDETASLLNIAPSTVDTHHQRATEKLTAAANLVQLLRTDPATLADADPDLVIEADTDESNDSRSFS